MPISEPISERILERVDDESHAEPALLAQLFCAVLQTKYNVLNLKDYRLDLHPPLGVPVTPCLDHEAQIHEHELPHLGGYVQHRETGQICGVVYLPVPRRIIVEEEQLDSERELEELASFFRARYPDHDVKVQRLRRGSAYVRARDVAEAHVPLECVLAGEDQPSIQTHLDQLNGISTLMEKESRVTSWGMRTAYAPLMAAIAFLLVLAFPDGGGAFQVGDWIRLGCLLAIGGAFLYYGLKAVQLTKTATRLNKRIQEYRFILAARQIPDLGGGGCFQSKGDDRPQAGPASPHQEALAKLLADCDEVAGIAWYVTNRYRSAQVVMDGAGETENPMLTAICRLRLDTIAFQRAELATRYDELLDTGCAPAIVSERARLKQRVGILDKKAASLQSHLG